MKEKKKKRNRRRRKGTNYEQISNEMEEGEKEKKLSTASKEMTWRSEEDSNRYFWRKVKGTEPTQNAGKEKEQDKK